jgi:hypothetical protein
MFLCVYSVFVLSCVGSGLPTGWYSIQGLLPTILDEETELKQSISQMPYAPQWEQQEKEREVYGEHLHNLSCETETFEGNLWILSDLMILWIKSNI